MYKRNGGREAAELSGGQIPENLEGQNKELGQSMFLREHPGYHEGEWMERAGLGTISPGPQCQVWPKDV